MEGVRSEMLAIRCGVLPAHSNMKDKRHANASFDFLHLHT